MAAPGNFLWFILGGRILAIIWLVVGVVFSITIVGSPVAVVYVRMGKFLISPAGCRVVSKKQAFASSLLLPTKPPTYFVPLRSAVE